MKRSPSAFWLSPLRRMTSLGKQQQFRKFKVDSPGWLLFSLSVIVPVVAWWVSG